MKIFENIVGQSQVIETLKSAVTASRENSDFSHKMTHSWLFTGPPGTGKSTVAKAFAAALLCSKSGCGECVDCQTAMNGSHFDIDIFKTKTSAIKVDEIRELISRTSTSPSISNWRVVIIQDAQRLTETAANALLKVIEEPSARTIWILTNVSNIDIPPTLISRCRQIQFRNLNAKSISKILLERYISDIQIAEYAANVSRGNLKIAIFISLNPEVRHHRNKLITQILNEGTVFQKYSTAAEIIDLVKTYTLLCQSTVNIENFNDNSPPTKLDIEEKRIFEFILNDLSFLYLDLWYVKIGKDEKIINADFMKQLIQKSEKSSGEMIIDTIHNLVIAKEKFTRNTKLIGLENILINKYDA